MRRPRVSGEVSFFCILIPLFRLNGKSRLIYTFSASPAQSMRSKPLGVARAACFERLADVFAKRDARTPSSQAICQTPRHTNHRSTSATVHPRARGTDNDHR